MREAFLAHSLAVTDVYVRLVLAERVGALEVRRFSAEPQSWRICYGPGGVRTKLKPDAYVVLAVDGYEDHWFIEVDLGTERAPALGRKCALYRAYWQSGTEEADGGVFRACCGWCATSGGPRYCERSCGGSRAMRPSCSMSPSSTEWWHGYSWGQHHERAASQHHLDRRCHGETSRPA